MVDNEDDGARLTRREENRELIAKHRAEVEPRGCPTPGSCSAVEELADLKQRILPQFAGRAQRAEHERDAMLEQLIVHRTANANLHDEINKMRNALAPSATAATDLNEFVRLARTFSDEHFQNSLVAELRRVYHALALQDAPPVEVAEPDRPDWARQLPGAEIFDRAARGGHAYDRSASLAAGRYVCVCGGACSNYTTEGLPK